MKWIKNSMVILLSIFFGTSFLATQSAFGDMSNYELDQRIKELGKRVKKAEEKNPPLISEKWFDRVNLSGAIELDFSYISDRDTSDNTINDSSSDLDIGTAELGLEAALHKYVTANFILKGEDLDEDNDRVFWDEASITIQKEGFPIYFIGGKRGQPFGLFESHLTQDPITQDCYEIVESGATLGYTPGVLGLDISVTAYKGEQLMTHMLEGAYNLNRNYFDLDTAVAAAWRNSGAGGMSAQYDETDGVNSYIGNITAEPTEGLLLALYFDSEPGDRNRNETLGGSIHYEIGKFYLDWEYIGAVQREKDPANNVERKEKAWFAGIAFQAMAPLELAARYEAFDDDIPGQQDGHLDDRFSLGLTYTLLEKNDFKTNLMAEYRKSNLEIRPGNPGNVDENVSEFFTRIAIEF